MPRLSVILLAVMLPACSTPGVAPEADALFSRWPPVTDEPWLEFEGGELRGVATPVAEGELPRRARVAADAILGGIEGAAWRMWSHGDGVTSFEFRVGGDTGARRTVRVDEDGNVLERSHTIPVADAPAPIARLATGDTVEFLQGRGPDRYRVVERGPNAAGTRYTDYTPDGHRHARGTWRTARVHAVE